MKTFESVIVSAIYGIAFCLVVVIGLSGIQPLKLKSAVYKGKANVVDLLQADLQPLALSLKRTFRKSR